MRKSKPRCLMDKEEYNKESDFIIYPIINDKNTSFFIYDFSKEERYLIAKEGHYPPTKIPKENIFPILSKVTKFHWITKDEFDYYIGKQGYNLIKNKYPELLI